MKNYTGSTLQKTQCFGYWRWVHLRKCSKCGDVTKILGNDTRRPPSLGVGAILCHCGAQITL